MSNTAGKSILGSSNRLLNPNLEYERNFLQIYFMWPKDFFFARHKKDRSTEPHKPYLPQWCSEKMVMPWCSTGSVPQN